MDRLLCLQRQHRTFLAHTTNRLQQVNAHLGPRLGKQAHQVRYQVVITDERRNRIELAIAQILDSHRLHRHTSVDGSGQQAAMEGAQGATVGRGAFGEDQQRSSQAQLPGDLFAQALAVATAPDE